MGGRERETSPVIGVLYAQSAEGKRNRGKITQNCGKEKRGKTLKRKDLLLRLYEANDLSRASKVKSLIDFLRRAPEGSGRLEKKGKRTKSSLQEDLRWKKQTPSTRGKGGGETKLSLPCVRGGKLLDKLKWPGGAEWL